MEVPLALLDLEGKRTIRQSRRGDVCERKLNRNGRLMCRVSAPGAGRESNCRGKIAPRVSFYRGSLTRFRDNRITRNYRDRSSNRCVRIHFAGRRQMERSIRSWVKGPLPLCRWNSADRINIPINRDPCKIIPVLP